MNARLLGWTALALLWAACPTCVDLETPRAYRCQRDGGQDSCPEGWRCGLEEFCHDTAVAAPYLCETSDDCEQGWHCGAGGRCYDRLDAGAVPCRSDVDDCAPGWRCGLEGVCLDTAVAGAHRCAGDNDCTQGWRCGVDGRCVDPAPEALPTHDIPLGSVERVSPKLFAQAPSHVAFTLPYQESALPLPDGGTPQGVPFNGRPYRSIAYAIDGQLGFVTGLGNDGPTAGWLVHPTPPGDAGRIAADAGLAASGNRVYVLSNGLSELEYPLDGGLPALRSLTSGGTPVSADALRLSQGTSTLLACFGPEQSSVFYHRPGAPNAIQASPPLLLDGGTARVYDMAGFDVAGEQCLVAATDHGLFISTAATALEPPGNWSNWFLHRLHNTRCGPSNEPTMLYARSFRTSASGLLAVEGWVGGGLSSPPPVGDAVVLTLVDVAGMVAAQHCDRSNMSDLCRPAWQLDAPLARDCRACPGTARLVDYRPVRDERGAGFEVRCQASATSSVVQTYRLLARHGGGCEREELSSDSVLFSEATLAQTSAPQLFGHAGRSGELWFGEQPSTAKPVLFDRKAEGIAELLFDAPDGGLSIPVVFTDSLVGFENDQIGLAAQDVDVERGLVPLAAVHGTVRWVVMGNRSLVQLRSDPTVPESEGLEVFGRVDTTPDRFKTPVRATLAPRATGGVQLLVSAHDTLYAAPVPDPRHSPKGTIDIADAGQTVLLQRLTPAPTSPILSLAAVPPMAFDGGTSLMSAYALTGTALYSVRAETETRWRATELLLPDGDALEVWADGAKARVGLRDGKVFSLPSRVLLAPPVPDETSVADFAHLCGQTYALAKGGLYRLKPSQDGSGVGSWVKESLAGGFLAGPVPDGLDRGSLIPLRDTLYVFTGRGAATRVKPASCPP